MLRCYFRHLTLIWVNTSKAMDQDVGETHCANSGILKCHGPGPATQSGNHNSIWLKKTNQKQSSPKPEKKCPVNNIKSVQTWFLLQGIICTVCTQANDTSIPADNLEQSITHFSLWWVQICRSNTGG